MAGVSPINYDRRGFDDLFIRGFDSGESTIIDGLAQSGNSSIGLRLQSYGYEHFEVLKGASSLLYGRVQPGGMVNAISKRPKRDALGEVHLEAGSFGNRVAVFDINRPHIPAMPINIPQNAEVPMAFLMSTLREFKNGTINPPPPIPATLDIMPIKEPPIIDDNGVIFLFGSTFFGLIDKIILTTSKIGRASCRERV